MTDSLSMALLNLSLMLVAGILIGFMLARAMMGRRVKKLERDLAGKAQEARAQLALEFGGELEKIRNNLLGIARSYDGALKLLRTNIPDGIEATISKVDGVELPRELEFKPTPTIQSQGSKGQAANS